MSEPGWLEMPEKTPFSFFSPSTFDTRCQTQWVTGINCLPSSSWYVSASVAAETFHFCSNTKCLGQRLANKGGFWTWARQSIFIDLGYFSSDYWIIFIVCCLSCLVHDESGSRSHTHFSASGIGVFNIIH